ncbi:lipase [Lithospermum erythrorhizon]|uniref:Lipase n=1 Tax=Lithospermum erythrorhizon TaxID=34254 RepID=A0AAV3RWL3_LITER
MSSCRERRNQRWCAPPLTPLNEGPDDLYVQNEGVKKESSWEAIREWFRTQKSLPGGGTNGFSASAYGSISPPKRQDLRLLLGVLGCPLAPIPLVNKPPNHLHIRDIPIECSAAHYILQQYLAATGTSKKKTCPKNMYTVGMVKMVCCPTEISTGKNVKTLGARTGENGCFVLWQMSPGMWSLELVVGGNKVIAGSDGKIVWRHTPWLGTHAAKGPQRPLRRIIQGLDPKSTSILFAKAQCLGEKTIGDEDCFVLKVAADRAAVMERSEGPAEVIRHVLYGYFSQKSGLLIYMEDSHLTRVQAGENEAVYWETSIGSSIGDYKDVDGVLIAHQGRTIATVFRFGETSEQHCRTRMEEVWEIQDVVYNVPGLSIDSFIPPADIYKQVMSSP